MPIYIIDQALGSMKLGQSLRANRKMASEVGSDQPLKYVLKAYKGSHQITLADVQPRDPVRSESVAGCAGRKDYGMA